MIHSMHFLLIDSFLKSTSVSWWLFIFHQSQESNRINIMENSLYVSFICQNFIKYDIFMSRFFLHTQVVTPWSGILVTYKWRCSRTRDVSAFFLTKCLEADIGIIWIMPEGKREREQRRRKWYLTAHFYWACGQYNYRTTSLIVIHLHIKPHICISFPP